MTISTCPICSGRCPICQHPFEDRPVRIRNVNGKPYRYQTPPMQRLTYCSPTCCRRSVQAKAAYIERSGDHRKAERQREIPTYGGKARANAARASMNERGV